MPAKINMSFLFTSALCMALLLITSSLALRGSLRRSLSTGIAPIAPWSKLPRAIHQMAVGFDSDTNLIWILGGGWFSRQLISFNVSKWNDPSPFTDYGINYLPQSVQASSQCYTQIGDYLYIIDDNIYNRHINRFTLSTQTFVYDWNLISIPFGADYFSCLTHIDDYLIVSGGYWDLVWYSHVAIYNISKDSWLLNVPSMNIGRAHHACLVNPNTKYLYQIGGYIASTTYTATIEMLYVGDLHNIGSYTFSIIADTLQSPRFFVRAVLFNDNIYVIGGNYYNGSHYDEIEPIEVVDTLTNTITMSDELERGVWYSGPVVVPDTDSDPSCSARIYIFGGKHNRTSQDIWQYHDIDECPIATTTPAPTICDECQEMIIDLINDRMDEVTDLINNLTQLTQNEFTLLTDLINDKFDDLSYSINNVSNNIDGEFEEYTDLYATDYNNQNEWIDIKFNDTYNQLCQIFEYITKPPRPSHHKQPPPPPLNCLQPTDVDVPESGDTSLSTMNVLQNGFVAKSFNNFNPMMNGLEHLNQGNVQNMNKIFTYNEKLFLFIAIGAVLCMNVILFCMFIWSHFANKTPKKYQYVIPQLDDEEDQRVDLK